MSLPKARIVVLYFHPSHTDADIFERLSGLHTQSFSLHPVCVPSCDLESDSRTLLDTMHGCIIMGASDLYLDGACDQSDEKKQNALRIHAFLEPLIEHLVAHDTPTFAFCFGHQLIAHTRGGVVARCTTTGKVGTHLVHKTDHGKTDTLLADLPDSFGANYGHKDAVIHAPQDATLLMYGDRCHNAMLRYGKNVYTTQFHPELRKSHLESFLSEYTDYCEVHPHFSIDDTPHSSSLISAFGERILRCC